MTTPDIRRRRLLAPVAGDVGSHTPDDLDAGSEPGPDDAEGPGGLDDAEGPGGLDDAESHRALGAASTGDPEPGRHDRSTYAAPDDRVGRRPVDVRRRRRVRTVAAAAVVALVAFLALSGLQARGQLERSTGAFASTRAEQRSTLARLGRTEASLATVLDQSAAADRTLGSVNAALAAERSQLAQQQRNLFIQGVSISALDTCLGGVESALNEVALNDQPGAISTLQGVSADCRTAGASGG